MTKQYSLISYTAKLGKGVIIGDFSQIKNCIIGDNTTIGNRCDIYGGTIIGKDVKIWHSCNIYGCSIGDNTQIGTFNEIKQGATVGEFCRFQCGVFIPEETKIGNYVFLGPHVLITNDKHPTAMNAIKKTWNLEAVIIEDHASIGAGAILNPGIKIGKHAIVGSGALVTKDILDYHIVVGAPAKKVGDKREHKNFAIDYENSI